jgi:hypothetical protein
MPQKHLVICKLLFQDQARQNFLEKAPALLTALEKLLDASGTGFYVGSEVRRHRTSFFSTMQKYVTI